MLICRSCGLECDDGKNYCRRCGSPLEQVAVVPWCDTCGVAQAAGKKFCRHCGTALTTRPGPAAAAGQAAAARVTPSAEIRTVFGSRRAALAMGAVVLVLAVLAAAVAVVSSLRSAAPSSTRPAPLLGAPTTDRPARSPSPGEQPTAGEVSAPPAALPPLARGPEPTAPRTAASAQNRGSDANVLPSAPTLLGMPTDSTYLDSLSFDRYQARERLAEGLKHYHARGGARDPVRAFEAFGAAAATEGRACYYLAQMYTQGDGIARDHGVALTWLRKGAALGDTECQFALGELLMRGEPGVVEANEADGIRWLREAAARGHREAARRLAQLRR